MVGRKKIFKEKLDRVKEGYLSVGEGTVLIPPKKSKLKK